MAEERELKAGTPAPDETGDDAAKQAALAESDGAEDRDAGAEGEDEKAGRTDWKALALTYKGKAEAANAHERRIAELESALREAKQSPTPDPQASREADELRELQNDLMLAERMAVEYKDSEPGIAASARLTIRNLKMQIADSQQRAEERRQSEQERINDRFMTRAEVVGDDGEIRPLTKDEGRDFEAFFGTNARLFGGNKEAAFDAWDGRRLREQAKSLAKQARRAKETDERRTDGVVRTHMRDVTAPEVRAREFSSEDAYQAELARLRESDPAAAWALQRARMNGKARVR